jgi:flagellar motor switch/type III secretory pathway protein FliN
MTTLNKSNLLDVMNRMRSLVPPEETPPECAAVSWTVPHHFSAEARAVLLDFSNKLAVQLQETLQTLCDEDAAVTFTGMTEHFTTLLFPQIHQDRKDSYYLPVSGRETVGLLELPFDTCAKLIALMLKNPDAEIGSEGELSSLEESILMDVAGPMTDALAGAFVRQDGPTLRTAEAPVQGSVLERFGDLDDLCQWSFEATCASNTLACSFYMLDERVDPLVGIAAVDRSPETLKKMPERIIGRLQDVWMDVSVRLSAAMIDLQDVLMLEKDDVLVLERNVSMPADVVVNGRHCFDAWPARHRGRGAVVIAGPKTAHRIN